MVPGPSIKFEARHSMQMPSKGCERGMLATTNTELLLVPRVAFLSLLEPASLPSKHLVALPLPFIRFRCDRPVAPWEAHAGHSPRLGTHGLFSKLHGPTVPRWGPGPPSGRTSQQICGRSHLNGGRGEFQPRGRKGNDDRGKGDSEYVSEDGYKAEAGLWR